MEKTDEQKAILQLQSEVALLKLQIQELMTKLGFNQ